MSTEYHRLKAENESLLQKVPKNENELENLKKQESENITLKENLKQIQVNFEVFMRAFDQTNNYFKRRNT